MEYKQNYPELHKPLFSIIIPTYHRGHNILPTLHSVQQQSYTNWECIVVDDGGNDNSRQVIENLEDKRFQYFWKSNGERGAARNFGTQKASGEYVTFLDSDDIMYPHYLEEAYNLIQQHPYGVFFHIAYEIKDQQAKVIRQFHNRRGNLNRQLITGNHLSNIGVVLTTQVAKENPYNENRVLSGSEDYELWLRLAARHHIYYYNRVSAALIQHDERSVLNINSRQLITRINLLIDYALADEEVKGFLSKKKSTFLVHRYAYLALHLAMGRYAQASLKYLIKLLWLKPAFILNRKFWGIAKNLIKSVL